jgi:hypothetical protein
MIRVHFSVALANAVPFAKRRLIDLPDWAADPINAECTAAEVGRKFFDVRYGAWERFIGAEVFRAKVVVGISRPLAIAGQYDVTISRSVSARGMRPIISRQIHLQPKKEAS